MATSPPPEEPVVREFDYELLAKIAAKNRLLRERGLVERTTVESYRRPEPNYLSGTGVMASVSNNKRPSQREAIAKARQKLRQVSLSRQLALPRPST
ncbi:MAG TPA: hypothetical protein VFI31_00405 [Pirellulales bacterium]|nr:hypothetical protein [Pirellulales bacterium]